MKCFPFAGLAVDLSPCQLLLTGRLGPDLTICDHSLWGFIKEKVSQQRYTNTDEFKKVVADAFN